MTNHPEFKTEFIQSNGLTLEVLTCCAGVTLALCLHGLPEVALSWRQQLPALLGMGYLVWAPQQRGYGASSRPQRTQDSIELDRRRFGADRCFGSTPRSSAGARVGRYCGLVLCRSSFARAGAPRHPQRAASCVFRAQPASARADASIVVCGLLPGALGGDWNHSFYNAAKGAITNFTRALALDEAKHGVRVNAVNPSLVHTAMTAQMKTQPQLIEKFEERMPWVGVRTRRTSKPDSIFGQ